MYCPFISKHLCSLASSSIFFHLPLKRGCFTGLSLCSLSLDNVICLPGVNCHIKVHGVMSIWVKYFPFTHLCCLPTSFLNSGHIFPNAVWKDPLHVTSYTDIHLFIFLLSPFFMIRSYLSLCLQHNAQATAEIQWIFSEWVSSGVSVAHIQHVFLTLPLVASVSVFLAHTST